MSARDNTSVRQDDDGARDVGIGHGHWGDAVAGTGGEPFSLRSRRKAVSQALQGDRLQENSIARKAVGAQRIRPYPPTRDGGSAWLIAILAPHYGAHTTHEVLGLKIEKVLNCSIADTVEQRGTQLNVVAHRKYRPSELLLSGFKSLLRHSTMWFAMRHIRAKRRQMVSFNFDYIGVELNLSGVYEEEQLKLLFRWIEKAAPAVLRGTAVDVGANIGNHSLFFSDYFSRVSSFEITPRTFKVLQLNAELSDRITAYNVGLSDKVGEAYLAVNSANLGDNRIVQAATEATHTVPVSTLDAFELGAVSLIKIDVQGHEWQVLKGSKETIRKHFPLIIFEQTAEDFAIGSSPSIDLLKDYGYTTFLTMDDTPKRFIRLRGVRTEVLQSLLWAVSGYSLKLRRCTTVEPRNHAFIVAVPPLLELAAQGSVR